MQFERKTPSRAWGIAIMAGIFILILYSYYNGDQSLVTSLPQSIYKNGVGDTISFFDKQQYQQYASLLPQGASNVLTASDLPATLKAIGTPAILSNPALTNSNISNTTGEQFSGNVVNKAVSKTTGQLVPITSHSFDNNGLPIYHSGEEVSPFGTLVKKSPPPYFYNIEVTCCGNSPQIAKEHLETDAQGNWEYDIVTNYQFATGIWTVTVSTVGSDNALFSKSWSFDLQS